MGCPAFSESSSPMPGTKPLTYSDYINDRAMVEALRLPSIPKDVPSDRWPDTSAWQAGDDWPDTDPWVHDEVLFIRTHQAFEVWFAQVIHEIGSVINDACRALGGMSVVPRVHLDQGSE